MSLKYEPSSDTLNPTPSTLHPKHSTLYSILTPQSGSRERDNAALGTHGQVQGPSPLTSEIQHNTLNPQTLNTILNPFSSLLLSSLELSDTQVYEPYIRARLGTAAHPYPLTRKQGA